MMLFALSRDFRLDGWCLMDSPVEILALCALYLAVVLQLGPRLMSGRPPLNIKLLVRSFNLVQIVSNLYFVAYAANLAYSKIGFRLLCEPLHRRTDDDSLKLLGLFHFYFLVRVSDFIDTLFFVLTKKSAHVSFLHVYHHVCVAVNGWLGLRYGWINGVLLGVLINASIHVVMYSYYFLATFPKMKRHLWWKKYITMAQIIQFIVFCLLARMVIFRNDTCQYPSIVIYNGLANIILLLSLFTKFYLNTYLGKSQMRIKAT